MLGTPAAYTRATLLSVRRTTATQTLGTAAASHTTNETSCLRQLVANRGTLLGLCPLDLGIGSSISGPHIRHDSPHCSWPNAIGTIQGRSDGKLGL